MQKNWFKQFLSILIVFSTPCYGNGNFYDNLVDGNIIENWPDDKCIATHENFLICKFKGRLYFA